MGEITVGDREIDTDVRRWSGDVRRDASLILGAAAGLFLLAALVYYALNAAGSGWFLWVAIVVLAVLLVAEAVVLATGIAREEDVGPPWLTGETQAASATAETETADETTVGGPASASPEPAREPEPAPEIDLQCPECSEMFAVEDTGERPLATECPHCGAQGHVNLPETTDEPDDHDSTAGAGGGAVAGDPLAGLGDDEPEDEDVETISLECPVCDTQFDTEDTGERPLRTECPGCGRSGKLG